MFRSLHPSPQRQLNLRRREIAGLNQGTGSEVEFGA